MKISSQIKVSSISYASLSVLLFSRYILYDSSNSNFKHNKDALILGDSQSPFSSKPHCKWHTSLGAGDAQDAAGMFSMARLCQYHNVVSHVYHLLACCASSSCEF